MVTVYWKQHSGGVVGIGIDLNPHMTLATSLWTSYLTLLSLE